VNSAFLRIWGYDDSEEVLGRSVISLFKEEEKAHGLVQTVLTGRGIEAAEMVARKKDGTEFIVGLRASLIINAEGQPIGLTASLADITERKKAEDEKEKLP